MRPARDGLENAAVILDVRVIVDVFREARSYSELGRPQVLQTLSKFNVGASARLRPARDGLESAAVILNARVVVDVFREQTERRPAAPTRPGIV